MDQEIQDAFSGRFILVVVLVALIALGWAGLRVYQLEHKLPAMERKGECAVMSTLYCHAFYDSEDD